MDSDLSNKYITQTILDKYELENRSIYGMQ